MTAVIDRSCNWIRNHFDREKVNKFSIVVIMIYYYVGLLSYITTPFSNFYQYFKSSSSIAVFLRALLTAMICLYCLLIIIINKERIQWKWAIVFIYILLFTLLSTAISPQTYYYVYVSNNNYSVVYLAKISTGFNRLFTMYLSSISDFALAFCFLFILPIVFNNKKRLLYLLVPIVIIGIFECAYSVITEKEDYIKLINMIDPQYGGYNINIGASFGNKEDWGAFTTVAFCSAIASLFCFNSKGVKNNILRLLLFLAAIVLFVFSVMSLCKTAIGAQSFFILVIMIYFAFYLYKKCFPFAIVYLIMVAVISIMLCLVYVVPSLHDNGLLSIIYKFTSAYIIDPIFAGKSAGRTEIWLRFINNLRTYNVFFGLSKGGVSAYSRVVTVEGQATIHNGFAYVFGSYGLLGFSIYLLLLIIVLRRIALLAKKDLGFAFLSFGLFLSALIFSLSESEVLIISGSNPIFIFNIMVCSVPGGLLKRTTHNEEVVYA